MRILERSVMIMVALIAHSALQNLSAHEFETGHIERSIDVVVRNRNVELKYSVGLSDETIVNWLVREEAISSADEDRFRKYIADYEAQEESDDQKKSVGSLDPTENDQPNGTDVPIVKSDEPAAFQTELAELLKEKLTSSICENLILKADEIILECASPSIAMSPRHHVAIEITLKATLPEVASAKLSIVDRNFLELKDVAANVDSAQASGAEAAERDTEKPSFRYFGNIRLACRVKGDAILLNSNVSPVLARSQAVNVTEYELEERVSAATITTKVGFANSNKP